MFGEPLLVGHKEVKIDEKNRIYLPAFTNACENDLLALINAIDSTGNPYVKIYLLKKYKEIVIKLKELQSHATSISEYFCYEKEIVNICETIYTILKVDKQRRILLPHNVMDINKFNGRNSLLCIGKGNYITLK